MTPTPRPDPAAPGALDAAAPAGHDADELVIEPGAHLRRYWTDVWRARGLLYYLAWRDVRVRYKQTALGLAWGVLRPLLSMVVFTFIFGRLAKLPTTGDNGYHVMVFAGLLPWQLFATGVLHGSASLTGNVALVTKVYFPRIVLPASSQAVAIVDFIVALGILFILMLADGHLPTWRIVFVPLFLLMAILPALGLALWLSALNVWYRDFAYLVPFGLQLGFFLSPVGFAAATIPEGVRVIYGLNPMVGVIDAFRWAVLDSPPPLDLRVVGLSFAVSVLLFVLGLRYFRRTEASFADRI
ncbi:MAG: ABC transporter permease [Myxococcota bacterium]